MSKEKENISHYHSETIHSMKQISSTLLDIKNHLQSIEGTLRLIAEPIAEQSLSFIFDDPQKIRVYELSDGVRSTRDIASVVGVSQMTVSRWLKKWKEEHEIVEQIGEQGQYRRKYLLIDLLLQNSNMHTYPTTQIGNNEASD